MSFSKDSKIEIIDSHKENADTAFAFLSGLFHASGEIEKSGKDFKAAIVTDIEELYPVVNELSHALYGDYLELDIEDDYIINKTTYYRITFPASFAERLLKDIGLIEITSDGYHLNWGIDSNVVCSDETKISFLRGAYLGCGTSSIRLSEVESEKTTSGYHLELTSHSHQFLTDLAALMAEFNIFTKLVERKNLFVLYIKEAEIIKDLLALLGASDSVMALSNEMIIREKRNQINREVNCINANISKTVDASMRQIEAINVIISTIGIDSLDEQLQEVAMLRLANPEESLDGLLSLSTLELSKSGLNHRLNKLIKIAKELK